MQGPCRNHFKIIAGGWPGVIFKRRLLHTYHPENLGKFFRMAFLVFSYLVTYFPIKTEDRT